MPGSAHPWSLAWERLIPHREVPISEVAGQQSHYFWLDGVDASIRRNVFVVFVQTVTAMVSPDLRSTPQNTSAAGPPGNRPRPTSGSHWRRVWPHRIVGVGLDRGGSPGTSSGSRVETGREPWAATCRPSPSDVAGRCAEDDQYATRTLNLRHTAASGTSMPGLNPRP